MSRFEFEWDPAKARRNLRTHGVSFEEAASVVENESSIAQEDVEHSEYEERDRVIGFSDKGRMIVVIVTGRGAKVRVISARKATRREIEQYGDSQA